MYFIERGIWAIQNDPKERGELEANMARALKKEKADSEKGGKSLPGIHDRVSEHPCADGSIYTFNDTYIELYSGALQDRRGVITALTLFLSTMVWMLGSLTIEMGSVWITHVHFGVKRAATTIDYIDPVIIGLIALGLCSAIYKFLWRFIRLENFVQRRLLIRFNRVTRQVYLHRPGYAGGLTTLSWDQVSPEPALGLPEWRGTGTQLMLAWTNDMTGLPYFHIMLVGKVANGTSDIVNLWEFIRRYMEEGPQSVPRPKKLLGKVPWPWLSLQAPWSFFKPLWRDGFKPRVLLWTALLSPVMVLHASLHWISLLLGWEPHWPRIIREAGLPGKPMPPISTAADWPSPPVIEPTKAKPRRTRKSCSNRICMTITFSVLGDASSRGGSAETSLSLSASGAYLRWLLQNTQRTLLRLILPQVIRWSVALAVPEVTAMLGLALGWAAAVGVLVAVAIWAITPDEMEGWCKQSCFGKHGPNSVGKPHENGEKELIGLFEAFSAVK